ncbi:Hsp20/alpha crystallin family protein [Bacteroidota bacterium]
MTLLRYKPYRELTDFHNKLNRCFYDTPSLKMSECLTPRIDMSETDQNITIEVELPGINKKDVKITMQDNILTIEGEKKNNKENKDVKHYRNERIYGSFSRKFRFPGSINIDKANAEYENGILTIVLTKEEPKKPEEKNIIVD